MDAAVTTAGERLTELLSPELRDRGANRTAGYLDLLETEPAGTGPSQALMLSRAVPAIYERWWRPALGRIVKGATGPGMGEEVRIARLLLGLGAGHTVLDIACGPGNFTRAFATTVGDEGLAVGVDVSKTMLAKGVHERERSGADNVALVRAEATALPFADAGFDAACCFAALHLFADPFAAIDEMRRVLAPGGRIALMTSVRRQLTLPPLKPVVERASGMRVFEREEIVAALRERDFTDIHQRISGLIQFVGARRPR